MMFCNNLLKISKNVSEISEKDRKSLFFLSQADTNAMVSHSQQIFNSELEKVITISFESKSNYDFPSEKNSWHQNSMTTARITCAVRDLYKMRI